MLRHRHRQKIPPNDPSGSKLSPNIAYGFADDAERNFRLQWIGKKFSAMSAMTSISPHYGNSLFPAHTQVPAVQRLRAVFRDDVVPLSTIAAIDLFERLWALHETARLDHFLRQKAPMRRYGKGRGPFRKVLPAHIPLRGFSLQQLALIKLYWPEPWPIPDRIEQSPARLVRGAAIIRKALYDFLHDGMFPRERAIKQEVERRLSAPAASPVEPDAFALIMRGSAQERFEAISHYYEQKRKKGPQYAAGSFQQRFKEWRATQSYDACAILRNVERELANPRYFSPIDIQKLEQRYSVASLPVFSTLKAIQSRSARLAICIEAAVQVSPNSKHLRLDLNLAEQVARKYNAFLLSETWPQKSASPKKLKIKTYLRYLQK